MRVRDLVRAANAVYRLEPGELCGDGRPQRLVEPRYLVFWLANRRLGIAYAKIGRLMNRDHTTVMHGVDRVGEWIINRPEIVTPLETIWTRAHEVAANDLETGQGQANGVPLIPDGPKAITPPPAPSVGEERRDDGFQFSRRWWREIEDRARRAFAAAGE